ncbi:hypothetical protein [Muricaecibacterium torontonense]|uniref:hypothetical protein n=1 Tax=Muricaecibacterium torontonense TaxID=3032871 RepID=UPI0010943B73|nr:hypothetical protein [Muricaecibacterium torontonense]
MHQARHYPARGLARIGKEEGAAFQANRKEIDHGSARLYHQHSVDPGWPLLVICIVCFLAPIVYNFVAPKPKKEDAAA